MRASRVVFVMCVCLWPSPSPGFDSDAERSVRLVLKQLSQGYDWGAAEKPINRLGDAASVALTKILEDQKPDEVQVRAILRVIQMAFAAPLIVPIEADRQPKTTLLVLQYLQFLTTNPELMKRIREMQLYVLEQAAKARVPP